MAVFIPVAVLASGFLADAVSAAPIAEQSVAEYQLDDEKMASIFSALGQILKKPGVAGGILGTFGALAGGVGSVLGATGQKRDVAFENMNDDEKMASIFSALGQILKKPGVAGGILGTFGALAGGVGSVLGATGQKRDVAFDNMNDDEKMASIFSALGQILKKPGVAGGILGTFGALAGGVGSVLGATGQKRDVAFDNMNDDEKMASIFSALGQILKKPGVAGGILGTFGALAGGVGSVLGATGQKRDVAFENMNDDEKMASIFSALGQILKKPGVAGGILGTFGALAGGVGSVLGSTGQKRDVAFENMNDDEKMASIFSALGQILKKPGVAGGILGTFGALAGGVGSVLGATGQKREVAFDNMSDEEKIASFWKFVPHIAGAIGGVLGLGAGVKQHIDNGKPKRSVGESTPLLGGDDEDKEAFWALVPAIAGAIGGAMGLGAGIKQHIDNGKPKRALFSSDFALERRDFEDAALLARMIDDSEFF